MKKYDAIVVGAGNAGLSAAATLSRVGLKTILFEKHNLPGGSATSFKRGRFEFETSLHELAQVGSEEKPGAVRKLFERLGAKVDWLNDTHLYRVISTDEKERYDANMPAGANEFIATLDKLVPGSKSSVTRFFALAQEGLDSMHEIASGEVGLFKIFRKHSTFMRLASHSVDEVMNILKIPLKAQHILTTYWPYIGEPTPTLDFLTFVMMFMVYVEDGVGLAKGLSHELSSSLDKVIRENGGEIRYNSPVSKILVKDGKAYGVSSNGEEFYSDHIICNCYPNDVFSHMLDENEIPEYEVRKANARDLALSFFTVYLGLNRSAEELGIKDYSVFLEPHADSLGQYENSFSLGGTGWVIVNCLNIVNPDCTEKGTSELFFTTSVYGDIWSKVKPEEYKKTKLKIAEEMIDYYEKTLGVSIKEHIEEIEVASPATFARYLSSPNGTPYGYQGHMWDSVIPRVVSSEQERSIKGLRFCGAHDYRMDGYGSTYFSGEGAAIKTIEDIERSKSNGKK